MSRYVELLLVILLPTAIGYALVVGIKAMRWASERRSAARWDSRATGLEPIERLAARLRRLRAQLDSVEAAANLPAKQLRLRALRSAYLDTLSAACRCLEATPPERGDRVPQAEIGRAEAALHERGLDVR